MKKSGNFSVYRGKKLIASNENQTKAFRLARQDALNQFADGKTLTYIVKGTFYDGVPGTALGELNRGRMNWKFAKPE